MKKWIEKQIINTWVHVISNDKTDKPLTIYLYVSGFSEKHAVKILNEELGYNQVTKKMSNMYIW